MKAIRPGLIPGSFGLVLFAAPLAVNALPRDTERLRAATATDTVRTVFVLRGQDDDGLEELATAVSHPASPQYGRYLSFDESVKRFGPAPDAGNAVVRYLEGKGSDVRIDDSGLFVEATLSANKVREITGVTLVQYRSPNRPAHFLAPDRPVVIPTELQGFVVAIGGLDETPVSKRLVRPGATIVPRSAAEPDSPNYYKSLRDLSGTPSGCPAALDLKAFTPNQWLRAYGLDQLQANGFTGKGERVGLIEFDGYLPSDLQTYTDCFGFPTPTPTVKLVPPATGPTFPDPEANLDLSVVAVAAPGLDGIDIFVIAHQYNSDISKALLRAVRAGNTVISMSFGYCESLYFPEETELTERAFKYAALAGVTVLASSGDSGVAGCSNDFTLAGLGNTGIQQADYLESVQYPASSPWITAVGGTNLVLNPDNTIKREIVWNDWTPYLVGVEQYFDIWAGTGGLSQLFPQPSWQTIKGPKRLVSARIVPDVALLADQNPGHKSAALLKRPLSLRWKPSLSGNHAPTEAFRPRISPGMMPRTDRRLAQGSRVCPNPFPCLTIRENHVERS